MATASYTTSMDVTEPHALVENAWDVLIQGKVRRQGAMDILEEAAQVRVAFGYLPIRASRT